ncbi:hypothetical protein SHL15_1206 [Streptomyces hygroscopicus subsp. limoneus]|nr:hypothetical protein SHL15_1206 [Streptomyces hygroscopicus subsp. limoneus]
MKAHEGDVLRFTSRTVGTPEHHATVVQVLGQNGEPPYRVRYEDGHETEIFPAAASGEAVTGLAAGGARSAQPGARLPLRRAARGAVATRSAATRSGRSPSHRGDGRGWMLLPRSGWKRVDTIRVRRLFG